MALGLSAFAQDSPEICTRGDAKSDHPSETAPAPHWVDPAAVAHLAAWQERMKEIKTLSAQFEKKDNDQVLKKMCVFSGQFAYMKPDKFLYRIESINDPGDYSAYLYTGNTVYEYDGRKQIVTTYLSPFVVQNTTENPYQKWIARWFRPPTFHEYFTGDMTPVDVVKDYRVKLYRPKTPDPGSAPLLRGRSKW
jgi:TIGR03009 family protein